jgi:hypothetical protein
MKNIKHLIVYLFLVASLTLNAQVTFSEYAIPDEELILRKDLESHVKKYSHIIQRDRSLDSLAEIRVNYFLSVLEETSKKPGMSLYGIMGGGSGKSKISEGSGGHDRYFGDPIFFKEPVGLKYPIWNPKLPKMNIKVNAEIFQASGVIFTRENSHSEISLISRYLDKYKSEYTTKFMINNYLESRNHSNAIKKYGDGKYGICTRVLCSKKWDKVEKVWIYEMVLFNLVIFSDPIE